MSRWFERQDSATVLRLRRLQEAEADLRNACNVEDAFTPRIRSAWDAVTSILTTLRGQMVSDGNLGPAQDGLRRRPHEHDWVYPYGDKRHKRLCRLCAQSQQTTTDDPEDW